MLVVEARMRQRVAWASRGWRESGRLITAELRLANAAVGRSDARMSVSVSAETQSRRYATLADHAAG